MHQQRYANSRRVRMVKNVKRAMIVARLPGPYQTGLFVHSVQTILRVVANISLQRLSQVPPQIAHALSWLDVSQRAFATCAR